MIPSVSNQTQKRFAVEELLGSKLVWRVLRVLLALPIIYHGATEIARELGTSHASVIRVLRRLQETSLISRRERRYRVNPDQPIVRYLWLLFQAERYRNLPAGLANKLELAAAERGGQVHAALLFGSWARGLADEQSDVDICLFGDGIRAGRALRPPYTFEFHAFPVRELDEPSTTVALDGLLNGIALKNPERVYDAAVKLRAFPKSFLLARLGQAEEFLARAEELPGPAGDYYRSLASRTLHQIQSILERGRTVSRRETPSQPASDVLLRQLSASIAREADSIWLT